MRQLKHTVLLNHWPEKLNYKHFFFFATDHLCHRMFFLFLVCKPFIVEKVVPLLVQRTRSCWALKESWLRITLFHVDCRTKFPWATSYTPSIGTFFHRLRLDVAYTRATSFIESIVQTPLGAVMDERVELFIICLLVFAHLFPFSTVSFACTLKNEVPSPQCKASFYPIRWSKDLSLRHVQFKFAKLGRFVANGCYKKVGV